MLKYTVVALHEMLKAFPDDEEKVSNVLNAFECANNKDVETFLKKLIVCYNSSREEIPDVGPSALSTM